MTTLAMAALISMGYASASVAAATTDQEQNGTKDVPQDTLKNQKDTAVEQILVTAQHTSAQQARKAQKEAPNLIDIRTVKEIEKLPDSTMAEAVRRMPGVSLETDEGEGRYVNIRGLDADLNSTTFDGIHLLPTNNASPFGGYRALALDSIPLGFIGAIKLTNSNLPDQDAEALGGTIDITPTAVPKNGKPFLEGTLGGGYEPLRGTTAGNYSVTAGGKIGDVSGVVNVMQSVDSRGIDDVEPAYYNDTNHPFTAVNNIEQRDYELHRNRHGYGLNLDYTPTAKDDYYLRAFETGYTEWYHRQYMDVNPDGNAVLGAGGISDTLTFPGGIQRSLRDEKETSTERLIMLGGKNEFDGGQQLDYHAAYVTGTYSKPYDYSSTFDYTPPDGSTSGTLNYCNCGAGHTPIYSVGGAAGYLDPANYSLSNFANSTALNYDKEASFGVNYKTPIALTSATDESLKFGLSARTRHKVTSDQPYSYDNLPALPMTSFIGSGGQESYYNGQYQNGVDIAPGYVQGTLGSGSISSGDVTSALQQYLNAYENVYGAYTQYEGKFGRLGVIGGVRVEHTDDRASAYSAGVDANGNPFAYPISSSHHYTNFFPSLQLRYALTDNSIVRAAYSSTIARPGFNQQNPALAIDVGSGIVTTGNPNLKPATANSFDLDFERYLPGDGIFAVGLFDKQISNYITPVTTNQALANNGLYPGSTQPFTEYTFRNSSGAYVRGAQINWSQHFTFLPGAWKGLGAGLNYTFVDSSFDIRPGERGTLPSTSRNTWNASLFYDYGPVSVDVALYHVSADLFAVGANKSSDVYNAARTSLDLGASYKVSNTTTFRFYAKNLLNTPHAFYQGDASRPIQREFYGPTFLAEVSFKI